MTTDELLAQLTELEAAASPGPWLYHHDSLYENGAASISWRPNGSSAALIVLLKEEALPALKALAAENAELRADLLRQREHEVREIDLWRQSQRHARDNWRIAQAELASTQASLSEATALLEAVMYTRSGYCRSCCSFAGPDLIQGVTGDEPHSESCSFADAYAFLARQKEAPNA